MSQSRITILTFWYLQKYYQSYAIFTSENSSLHVSNSISILYPVLMCEILIEKQFKIDSISVYVDKLCLLFLLLYLIQSLKRHWINNNYWPLGFIHPSFRVSCNPHVSHIVISWIYYQFRVILPCREGTWLFIVCEAHRPKPCIYHICT